MKNRAGQQRTALVVEDDPGMQRFLERALQREGWTVQVTATGSEAVSIYENDHPPVVLLDLNLPTLHGLDLLDVLRERDREPAILVLTGDTSPEMAAAGLRRGAEHFLTKPISVDYLTAVVEQAYEKVLLRRRARMLSAERLEAEFVPLGEAPAMQMLGEQIRRLAPTDSILLILGEPGTGRGWVAQRIHQQSDRAGSPFIRFSCAGLPAGFQEEELFGHERGVGGAKEQRRGLLESADGGTLLLDEVDALAPEAQYRLAGYLESGGFRRLGGGRDVRVDVRVMATSSRDLQQEVRERGFREELYYRLAVFPLTIPPLRDRSRGDLAALTAEILEELRRRMGLRHEIRVSEPALDVLCAYHWPGNIRELRNVLERTIIYHVDLIEVRPEHLPPLLQRTETGRYPLDPTLTLEEVERMHIEAALAHHGGNRSETSLSLGISRATLYNKLARYGIAERGEPLRRVK